MNTSARQGEIYIIEEEDSGRVKIGYAADSRKRLRILQTGNSHDLILRTALRFEDETARALEGLLHERFEEHQLRGEWFQLDWRTIEAAVAEEHERFNAMSGVDDDPTADLPLVWCVYPRRDNQTLKLFLNKGLIGPGLSGLGDLTKIEPTVEAFRQAWEQRYPGMSSGQVRAFYPMLFSFVHRVSVDDLVIFPVTWQDRIIHVGRISGPYQYKRWQLHGYCDFRPVEWIAQLQRNLFSSEALRGIQVNLAFFRVRNDRFLRELLALNLERAE